LVAVANHLLNKQDQKEQSIQHRVCNRYIRDRCCSKHKQGARHSRVETRSVKWIV
jgi:hypothetical protein